VTRYLLDTNIIINIVKPKPSDSLLGWMKAQRDVDLFIASLTVAEIRRGILEKPRSKKRDALDTWFSGRRGRRLCLRGACCHLTTRPAWSGPASLRKVRPPATPAAAPAPRGRLPGARYRVRDSRTRRRRARSHPMAIDALIIGLAIVLVDDEFERHRLIFKLKPLA
jgi:hypothetical protein